MKLKKGGSIVLWAMLVIGALAVLVQLSFRLGAEEKDRSAAAAISYDHILQLAEKSGESPESWLSGLSNAGVKYIIFDSTPDKSVLESVSAAGMLPAAQKELLEGDYAFYLPDKKIYPDTDLDLAMVEDIRRMSVEIHPDFDIDSAKNGMIKTFFLFDYYAKHFSFADRGQTLEDLIFLAVTDRGMRLIVLTPFIDKSLGMAVDMEHYTQVLSDLAVRLEDRGISFGGEVKPMPAEALNIILCWLSSLLPAAVAVKLICDLPFIRKRERLIKKLKIEDALCVLAFVGLGAGWFALPQAMQTLSMLASTLVFSCAAAISIASFSRTEPALLAKKSYFAAALAGFAALFIWAILGGAVVSALMSNKLFLLGGDIFTGVKISLLLPLAVVFLLLCIPVLRNIRHGKLRDWVYLSAALVFVAAIYLVLRLRSGDVNTISGIEETLRQWLEYNLYARPRTKELIFAVPAVPVFVWACRRKIMPLQLICGVGSCLECVSVINSFCHAVTPLRVSFMRSILAAGIGLVLGFLLVAVLSCIFGKKSRAE